MIYKEKERNKWVYTDDSGNVIRKSIRDYYLALLSPTGRVLGFGENEKAFAPWQNIYGEQKLKTVTIKAKRKR